MNLQKNVFYFGNSKLIGPQQVTLTSDDREGLKTLSSGKQEQVEQVSLLKPKGRNDRLHLPPCIYVVRAWVV